MDQPDNMNVLLQGRRDLIDVYGGDSTQILRTKEYLEKLGVRADISTSLYPDTGIYDIVHIFNSPFLDTCRMVKNAKEQGNKIVYSPVYLDYSEYDRNGRDGLQGLLCRLLGKYRSEDAKAIPGILSGKITAGDLPLLISGYKKIQNEIFGSVDLLLPNSKSEMERIKKDFDVGDILYEVIPNAVDKIFFEEAGDIESSMKKFDGCIMSAARIEGRKNQLNLVKAVKDLPHQLVLIGNSLKEQAPYIRRLRMESGPNVHFLGPVGHEDMPKYYRLAKVHCLVSWMETCGLSSMEAAASGCNIVITDKGDTREYFGDHAYYCDPGSVESIRHSIQKAFNSNKDATLKDLIKSSYTWEITADKTREAYYRALGKR